MRWPIIRTLLHKEVLRQLANRGGLALAALLIVAALLMALFRRDAGQNGILGGGVEECFIDYWRHDGWVRHLQQHVPPEYARRIRFRNIPQITEPGEVLAYPPGRGAIQMRPIRSADGSV